MSRLASITYYRVFPLTPIFVLRGKKSANYLQLFLELREISQRTEVSIRESERDGAGAASGKLKVWPNVTEIRRSLS